METKLTYREEVKSYTDIGSDIREITIKKNMADLSIDDFMEDILRPLLFAISYSAKAIDRYFDE